MTSSPSPALVCPKCGRGVQPEDVICPKCEFVLDVSFLGDDITDDERESRLKFAAQLEHVDAADDEDDYGEDALILGAGGPGEWESFATADTGLLQREVTNARVYLASNLQALTRPDAIPARAPDADVGQLNLSPFERHVYQFVNGRRPVGRIRRKSGMADDEVKTALALLADKGIIYLAGVVDEDRKQKAREKRRKKLRARLEERRDHRIDPRNVKTRVKADPLPASSTKKAAKRKETGPSVLDSELPTEAISLPPRRPATSMVANADTRIPEAQVANPFAASIPDTGSIVTRLISAPSADFTAPPHTDGSEAGTDVFAAAGTASVEDSSVAPPDADLSSGSSTALVEADVSISVAISEVEEDNVFSSSAADQGVFDDALEPTDGSIDELSSRHVLPLSESQPSMAEPRPMDTAFLIAAVEDVVGDVSEDGGAYLSIDDSAVEEEYAADFEGENEEEYEDEYEEGYDEEYEEQDDEDEGEEFDIAVERTGLLPAAISLELDDFEDSDEDESAPGLVPLPGAALTPPPGSLHSAPGLPGSAAPALPGAGVPTPSVALPGTAAPAPGRPTPAAVPPPATQPAAAARPAPAAAPAPAPAAAKGSGPSLENRRKAEKIFEQAQADFQAGRVSSARMNAKLALIYDPHNPTYRASFERWSAMSDPGGAPAKARSKDVELFEQAKDAEARADYREAARLLELAIKENPKAGALYNRLGVIQATRLRELRKASENLLTACELSPNNPAFKNNLGKVLGMQAAQSGQSVDLKESRDGMIRVKNIRPKMY